MTSPAPNILSDAVMAALAGVTPGATVGVAVSGGGDSMALLAAALGTGVAVCAATVDHGLRREAAGEAALVAEFCAAHDVPHQTLALDLAAGGGNLPARARDARYDALAGWAVREGLDAVLLGHTADDQAETVLMRLSRAAGVDGLAGMAPARDWKGVLWLRPFLHLPRGVLRQALQQQGIPWVEDPTNEDTSFHRTRVRQGFGHLEALGITRAGLVGTARHMARQRAVLEDARQRLLDQILTIGPLGEVTLETGPLLAALPETAARALGHVLQALSGRPYRPGYDALARVLEGIAKGFRTTQSLSACLIAEKDGRLLITRAPAETRPVALRQGVVVWEGRWRIAADGRQRLWAGALGKHGLERATAELRARGIDPEPRWAAAAQQTRRAVPAIFTDPGCLAGALAAVPGAGLVVAEVAMSVRATPPDTLILPDGVRQDGPD